MPITHQLDCAKNTPMAIQAQRRHVKIHTYGAFTAALFLTDTLKLSRFQGVKTKRK